VHIRSGTELDHLPGYVQSDHNGRPWRITKMQGSDVPLTSVVKPSRASSTLRTRTDLKRGSVESARHAAISI
jgi:hypothetical protein